MIAETYKVAKKRRTLFGSRIQKEGLLKLFLRKMPLPWVAAVAVVVLILLVVIVIWWWTCELVGWSVDPTATIMDFSGVQDPTTEAEAALQWYHIIHYEFRIHNIYSIIICTLHQIRVTLAPDQFSFVPLSWL